MIHQDLQGLVISYYKSSVMHPSENVHSVSECRGCCIFFIHLPIVQFIDAANGIPATLHCLQCYLWIIGVWLWLSWPPRSSSWLNGYNVDSLPAGSGRHVASNDKNWKESVSQCGLFWPWRGYFQFDHNWQTTLFLNFCRKLNLERT